MILPAGLLEWKYYDNKVTKKPAADNGTDPSRTAGLHCIYRLPDHSPFLDEPL